MQVKTTTIERVRGCELPPEWAERAGIDADDFVDVVIQPPREQRLKALLSLMDQVAEEAERRGLTEEKLEELLKDDD